MTQSTLEHLNITVPDAARTAKTLCDLLGWHIRWQGKAINGGFTVHVGGDASYLALYTPQGMPDTEAHDASYGQTGGLNHVGILVDDLDAVERKVVAAGFTPRNHADYEPGRRFYFHDRDGVEFEIVSYL